MNSFPDITDPYASFIKTTLLNGLDIHSLHLADKPWTAVRMIVHAGSRHEPRTLPGLAHFVEHMVASNLPGKNPEHTIAWFEKTGCGCALGSTSFHSTRFGFRLPNDTRKMTKAFGIFGSMLRQSPLDEHFERERTVIEREFAKKYPRPIELEWSLRASSSVFPGLWLENFSSAIGTLDSIKRIQSSDIRAFYDEFYVPANISIVTVGGMHPDQIAALIENSPFGTTGVGRRTLLPTQINVLPVVTEPIHEVSMSEIAKVSFDRARLTLTWSYPSSFPEDACDLFRDVLNDTMFRILRQEHKVVYSTSQCCTDFQDIGEYSITLEPKPSEIEKTLGLLHDCIKSAARDRKLFRQSKLALMRRFAMRDGVSGIDTADCAIGALATTRRITTLNEDYKLLQGVRFDQMAEMAGFLTEERAHTFILRP
jgi:predicted Zn-dependent peptidase